MYTHFVDLAQHLPSTKTNSLAGPALHNWPVLGPIALNERGRTQAAPLCEYDGAVVHLTGRPAGPLIMCKQPNVVGALTGIPLRGDRAATTA